MPSRPHKRSPLAVQLLLLLEEEPMHAYRMQQLIKERHKDTIVNIAQRNSVYQTLDRLLRDGLVEVRETSREGKRPRSTVYQLTGEGRETLMSWLRTMLSTPAREFPEFPVALASLPALPVAEVVDLLERRVSALEELLGTIDDDARAAGAMGVPRLFLVEDEYRRAMAVTELRWVRELIADLGEGRLSWRR
ncbi:PadR family transcriptional regulator [Nocardiopsis aegyptia]|uniref:DNA-binding PadR family transcriptional regulator n=1 Tax=Nocardiopsis aegyptia TaxID=220378 RepID=A0A7Z0JAZ4_9ACTN|nr:PadR family transcriptional regulator [Nocardiopsis aegyptia]NYJ34924.1 DNA-binding PadR family transcriptional regulator [Nocardiopsis aegyptia]